MTRYYRIASVTVRVDQDWQEALPLFEDFACAEEPQEADIRVRLFAGAKLFEPCYGVSFLCSPCAALFCSQEFPQVRMAASADWRELTIENAEGRVPGVMELFLTGFYSCFARRGGALLHASLVEYEGEGVVFLGPSGVGKTTQARLWQKHAGAHILNGDKVLLESVPGGRVLAWGSPWRGSSPYAVNRGVPLRALVLLSQAPENSLHPLRPEETFPALAPHVFYPAWDSDGTALLMETLGVCFSKAASFRLSCRPEEQAVTLLRRAVWGEARA